MSTFSVAMIDSTLFCGRERGREGEGEMEREKEGGEREGGEEGGKEREGRRRQGERTITTGRTNKIAG